MAEETGGAGQRALAVVAQARGRLAAMPAGRRNWLIGAGVGLLAVVAGTMWYAWRPDYRVLFSGLEGKDVQQVAQELGAAGIPFQMTADGTGVEVPAESVDKARMEVAAKGMPQSGRLGFELFDKPNWVGSEFDERVNYQRALEGELEHTIGTLGMVRSARVHLVLPRQSLFTSEEKVAKASVVLRLKRESLDREQTESIRNLVAGAVENLSPAQVTLVDADGRVNLEAQGAGAIEGGGERDLEAKLVAMLEPLAGAGNVRATVNVSYDEGSEERTDEVYDPAQSAAPTTQTSEQTSGDMRGARGVPGTPPLLRKDALPEFPRSGEVTRHLTHTEMGPGRVRRLTAAVLVNDRMTTDTTGKVAKTVWKPRSAEEMQRLEGLAQAAVGFDEKRGDQVVMENVSFSSNAPEVPAARVDKAVEQAKGLLATQPAMLKTGVMGLLGAMVVWFVLRPVAGQVVATLKEPVLVGDGGGRTAAVASGLPGVGGAEAVVLEERAAGRFAEVSGHMKRNPVHSMRLIEAWIASEGED